MDDLEFCAHVQLKAEVLERWVTSGWIVPGAAEGRNRYTEIDVARARLIDDLSVRCGVNDAGIDVILHLVDQLHGLHRSMNDVLSMLRAQSGPAQQQLAADLEAIISRRPRNLS
jgi:chaperone modulatory protein CbpM